MILYPKTTTVAYRCPVCGEITYGTVGVLNLGGNLVKLKCPCGESEITLQNTEDGKIRIVIPCMFCPNPHTFVISSKVMFSEPIFAFSCPYSDIDMCFIGEKGEVDKAVKESEEMLGELLDESDRDSLHEINKNLRENDYGDESVRDSILFVIDDLIEENHIYCDCDDSKGDIIIENGTDSVTVRCKKCGCSKKIICDHSIATELFLDAEKLKLIKQ